MAKVMTSADFYSVASVTARPDPAINLYSTGFLRATFGVFCFRDLQVCRGWQGILSFVL